MGKKGLKEIFYEVNDFNIFQAAGVAVWALKNMRCKNPGIKQSRVLLTSGNQWQLVQIDSDHNFEKTEIYTPSNKFRKIYQDVHMQSIVLGLIRYSLGTPTPQEQALKKVYDFVDERRFLQDKDKAAEAH